MFPALPNNWRIKSQSLVGLAKKKKNTKQNEGKKEERALVSEKSIGSLTLGSRFKELKIMES